MASSPTSVISLTLGVVVVCMMSMSSNAQLSSADYYTKSCPHLFPTVFSVVKSAVRNEPRMGASLLRLFFHDCFVQGCDASILLDGRSGEKFASPSVNSARGFEVIDNIKSAVEKVCPGVVSCADILAITAQDAVVLLGGPHWEMKLGRKDSRTSNQALANSSIPNAASSLNTLISSFQKQGLSTKDLVALYGAHTIGKARCTNFRQHIYQDKNVDAAFASNLKGNCPRTNGTGDNNLAPLDSQTWSYFDNAIYKDLVNRKGLLHSDQELYNGGGGSTAALVRTYSKDVNAFHRDFAAAMVNMGNIKPLTGSNGEIRRNCRRAN